MNYNNKMDIMLTYGWVRSSYAALRNFSSHNLKVVVGDASRTGMCQSSHLKKGFFKYKSPFTDNAFRFIEDLKDASQKFHPRMILPSHDETEIIAKYRGEFPSEVAIPLADFELINMANDKARMLVFADDLGISVPRQVGYSCVSDLANCIDDTKEYVIKLRQGNSAKGVFYSKGRDETISVVNETIFRFKLSEDRFPIVQERVHGEGWGVSCLYWEGIRIASFTHRRLREKIRTGGTSTLREGKPNVVLETAAYKLLDAMTWHGLIMVEFKYDPFSGGYWFIETNPRMWGSISLAIHSGVEFPYLTYLCATQGAAVARKYIEKSEQMGKIARWYLGDIIAAATEIGGKGSVLDAIRMCCPGGADVYDDFYWDDPFVFGGEILHYAYRFLTTRSLNPAEAGTIG